MKINSASVAILVASLTLAGAPRAAEATEVLDAASAEAYEAATRAAFAAGAAATATIVNPNYSNMFVQDTDFNGAAIASRRSSALGNYYHNSNLAYNTSASVGALFEPKSEFIKSISWLADLSFFSYTQTALSVLFSDSSLSAFFNDAEIDSPFNSVGYNLNSGNSAFNYNSSFSGNNNGLSGYYSNAGNPLFREPKDISE
jgi:hypothetical protein